MGLLNLDCHDLRLDGVPELREVEFDDGWISNAVLRSTMALPTLESLDVSNMGIHDSSDSHSTRLIGCVDFISGTCIQNRTILCRFAPTTFQTWKFSKSKATRRCGASIRPIAAAENAVAVCMPTGAIDRRTRNSAARIARSRSF